MTTRARVTAAIVLILAIGALLIGLRACSADDGGPDEPGATSEPTPEESLAPVEMSTTQISEAIRTRWDTMPLKEPEASSRPSGGTSLRLMPTSTRVRVEGWIRPNCLARRRLT